jgi:hypothetical protein
VSLAVLRRLFAGSSNREQLFVFIAHKVLGIDGEKERHRPDTGLGRAASLLSPFSSCSPWKTAFHSTLSEIEESLNP